MIVRVEMEENLSELGIRTRCWKISPHQVTESKRIHGPIVQPTTPKGLLADAARGQHLEA